MSDDETERTEPAEDAQPTGPTIRRDPPKSFARRHWKGLTLFTIVALPAAVLFAWATATLGYSYSAGQRAGFNQKVSRKGWICKTWEGELAVTPLPGVAPEIFRYSVRSDSVAHAIEALSGQSVTIFYKEHRGVPTSCFGETDYYATGVRKNGA